MRWQELVKRYLLFLFSLFLLGLGIAFAKTANLGISPVSSVSNVLSMSPTFDFFTIGTWLFLWNTLLTIGQIIILRKNFQLIQLMQIPLSLCLGWFTDLGMWILSPLTPEQYSYPILLAMVFICVLLLALSVALGVTANVVLNAGEGFVKAVADTWHFKFGNVKVIFDVVNVALAAGLSLLLLGRIEGIREGTVICAVCTGFVVKFLAPKVKPIEKFLSR